MNCRPGAFPRGPIEAHRLSAEARDWILVPPVPLADTPRSIDPGLLNGSWDGAAVEAAPLPSGRRHDVLDQKAYGGLFQQRQCAGRWETYSRRSRVAVDGTTGRTCDLLTTAQGHLADAPAPLGRRALSDLTFLP